jgi:hypothetical protein
MLFTMRNAGSTEWETFQVEEQSPNKTPGETVKGRM